MTYGGAKQAPRHDPWAGCLVSETAGSATSLGTRPSALILIVADGFVHTVVGTLGLVVLATIVGEFLVRFSLGMSPVYCFRLFPAYSFQLSGFYKHVFYLL